MCICMCVHVWIFVCKCWSRQGVDEEKGQQSLPPVPGVQPNHWFQSTETHVLVLMWACVCVSHRDSDISRDGDVAGNASATVARSQQPEPPLHGSRLSPPFFSPSISLSAPHLHSVPSASCHSSHWDKDKEGCKRLYSSMTLKRLVKQDDAILLFAICVSPVYTSRCWKVICVDRS